MSRMMTHSTAMFSGRPTVNPRFGMAFTTLPPDAISGSRAVLNQIEELVKEAVDRSGADIKVSRSSDQHNPGIVLNYQGTRAVISLHRATSSDPWRVMLTETSGRVQVLRKNVLEEVVVGSSTTLNHRDAIVIGDIPIALFLPR